MAVLVCNNPASEVPVDKTVRIGSGSDNELQLPPSSGVRKNHAVIARSSLFKVPVLIVPPGTDSQIQVNGRHVAHLKALRHRDRIRIGDYLLTYCELLVRTVAADSPLLGKLCEVCFEQIQIHDQTISCPRCLALCHQDCWCELTLCPTQADHYPAQEVMRRALTSWMRIEQLEAESELVRKSRKCAANKPRDESPFKRQEFVAYCPDCETGYHIECWLQLRCCTKCQRDVSGLIHRVLSATDASRDDLLSIGAGAGDER